jgi:hypothetical protein
MSHITQKELGRLLSSQELDLGILIKGVFMGAGGAKSATPAGEQSNSSKELEVLSPHLQQRWFEAIDRAELSRKGMKKKGRQDS